LTSLPDECSQLEKLTSINLSHNKMQKFPEVLALLPALVSANLSCNEIADISMESFGSAQSLQEINFLNNPLGEEAVYLLKSIVHFKITV